MILYAGWPSLEISEQYMKRSVAERSNHPDARLFRIPDEVIAVLTDF